MDVRSRNKFRVDVAVSWAVIVLFMAFILAMVSYHAHVERRCLVAGYPAHRIAWDLTGYCIREINETEYVVPLHQAERSPSRP